MKYRFYPIYLLAYETGIRAGEIMALKWDDVDLDNNTIKVDEGAVYNFHERQTTAELPKTNAGFRTIVISQGTIDVLRQYRQAHDFKSVYVFAGKHGAVKPYSSKAISKMLKVFLLRIGITRDFTFHDIRHTNASLMISSAVEVGVITERLGHSDISVTYRTYAHLLNESKGRNRAVVIA